MVGQITRKIKLNPPPAPSWAMTALRKHRPFWPSKIVIDFLKKLSISEDREGQCG